MAQGDANKMWVVPSDFGKALEGFARTLGAPGDDGVFRFEPSPVDEELQRPEDDSAEVEDWFATKRDPEVAQAVAEAEAVARKPVDPAVRTGLATEGAQGGAGEGQSALPTPPPAQRWMANDASEQPAEPPQQQ
jgi:hypothetical protein